MTDSIGLSTEQTYQLIIAIISMTGGTSIYKNVKQYLQIIKKDLHYVRDTVDMIDNFAQDPNDQNWNSLWNKFSASVKSRVPTTPTK